jgi:hypothetical protein
VDNEQPKLRMGQQAYLELMEQVKGYSLQFIDKSSAYAAYALSTNPDTSASEEAEQILSVTQAAAKVSNLPISKEILPLLRASNHPITNAAADYIEELLTMVTLHEQVITQLKSERTKHAARHEKKVISLEAELKRAGNNNFVRKHCK